MSISPAIVSSLSPVASGPRAQAIQTPIAGSATPVDIATDKLAPAIESRQIPSQKLSANDAPPNTDELGKLVSEMQRKVPVASKDLQFLVDQDSGRPIVKLTDSATKQVLWQVPSEVVLRIAKELDQFTKGSLVNHTA